ncbi:site-specific integrase [Mucilaginibacter sp. PPCGB 2223]|uniref:tyrosine-type recombinase/integrase n=1 Tax=Mucilaginibacter sp. PPCGB 2223 TaxID=1886027 RepID=UPI0009F366FB|nr:site-specific integrase [Mucilaginibacter sp. PPCGB 2223]
MTIAFTKEALDKLQPSDKRCYISDPKTFGLRLVVYENGTKTYILNRVIKGKPKKIRIGRYDCITISQAREKAKNLNAQIELGGDPHEEAQAQKRLLTFEQLFAKYYDWHLATESKAPDHNKAMLEIHIFPVLGREKAAEIKPTQISQLYEKIGSAISKYSKIDEIKYSYGSANRILNSVNAVFNFGIKHDLIACTNPCHGLKKVKGKSRDRFLNLDELKLFFDALKLEEKIFDDYFKTLLYCGARKSNVLSMEYPAINFDFKFWRLPETKTKNKEVNIIPLSDPVLKILITRAAFNEFYKEPSKFVFPGDGKSGHLTDPKKSFERIKKRMNVFDIRIHDLRRTLGSYMAINGISLPIIGKALNHKSQVSTEIYARLSHQPVLDAVNLAGSTMANLTAIRRR